MELQLQTYRGPEVFSSAPIETEDEIVTNKAVQRLTDLLHWCDTHNADIDYALALARMNFILEKKGH